MRSEYIFDLPVYRCSKERHEKEMDEAMQNHLRSCFDEQGLTHLADPETVTRITAHANHSFGGPWQFNEIVGWVRLFPESFGIGAHVWFTEGKRLTRKMRKRFHLRTSSNSLWTHFHPPFENVEIYSGVLQALKELTKRSPVKGRVLDLSVFYRIGPYVDWSRLIEEAAKERLSSEFQTSAVAPPHNPA